MYSALDVSRYIINYSNDQDYGISNLKLQKILYLVQAYYLIKTGFPCFSDVIEAWDFGPVVPIVYHEYKQYGSGDIPYISSYIQFDKKNIWQTHRVNYKDSIIDVDDKKMIEAVVDKFKDFSASDLVALTHSQAPWINAYKKYANNEITIKSIRDYFVNGE